MIYQANYNDYDGSGIEFRVVGGKEDVEQMIGFLREQGWTGKRNKVKGDKDGISWYVNQYGYKSSNTYDLHVWIKDRRSDAALFRVRFGFKQ